MYEFALHGQCILLLSVRILGFRRAPLVMGRFMNLRTEIKPVATDQLLSTFLMHGQSPPLSLYLFIYLFIFCAFTSEQALRGINRNFNFDRNVYSSQQSRPRVCWL